ncbi:MAG: hypothetical protein HYS43_01475 [Candidatus Liptonbacteria bacterium]|nr:hypothetical protein [Candidatus Liptonbacteria bacterium]
MEKFPKPDNVEQYPGMEEKEIKEFIGKLAARLKDIGNETKNREVWEIGDCLTMLAWGSPESLLHNRKNLDDQIKKAEEAESPEFDRVTEALKAEALKEAQEKEAGGKLN